MTSSDAFRVLLTSIVVIGNQIDDNEGEQNEGESEAVDEKSFLVLLTVTFTANSKMAISTSGVKERLTRTEKYK